MLDGAAASPSADQTLTGKSLSCADSPTIQSLRDSLNQAFPHKNGGMCCVETITTMGSLQEEDLPSYHKPGHELPF